MQAVSVRRITPVMICLAKGCDSLCVCGKEAAGGTAGGCRLIVIVSAGFPLEGA